MRDVWGCLGIILVGVVVVGLFIFGIVQGLGELADNEAQRIEAQAAADHQASVDWQHEFMTWTAYLAATGQTGCLKAGGVPSWLLYAGLFSAGCLGAFAGLVWGRAGERQQ